jgi:hypothetical protein
MIQQFDQDAMGRYVRNKEAVHMVSTLPGISLLVVLSPEAFHSCLPTSVESRNHERISCMLVEHVTQDKQPRLQFSSYVRR